MLPPMGRDHRESGDASYLWPSSKDFLPGRADVMNGARTARIECTVWMNGVEGSPTVG
jgi:hypothetical protein